MTDSQRPATGDGNRTTLRDRYDDLECAIADYVSAAVQEARIGWVDHATMVSQVNAAVAAERAWWCKNFHRVMFFDSIGPPSKPWAYNQGTSDAAKFVWYRSLDALVSIEMRQEKP